MKLFRKYTSETPTLALVSTFLSRYGPLIYDHIAIRTFDKNNISKKLINTYNFTKMNDNFNFPKHNANAIWFKNYDSKFRRIFLSEYNGIYNDKILTNSDTDMNKIQHYINNPNKMPYNEYLKILDKNQYLAWTILNKNTINHLAFQVDDIYNIIDNIPNNIKLSSSIQISSDGLLLQTSTVADMVKHKFACGNEEWLPGSFVEFIERKNNRDGFDENNANVIFKSTEKKY